VKFIFRKIITSLLLLAGIMPVAFSLFFLLKQQAIRHAMKEKLEKQLLHSIVVAEKDVLWVKYHKEIRVQGKMFDITSYSFDKGYYTFTGLFDEEETALHQCLENDINQKKKEGGNLIAQLYQCLQSACTEQGDETCLLHLKSDNTGILILLHIPSPFINILTPPPQAL